MTEIQVRGGNFTYPVRIGRGILGRLGEEVEATRVACVSNPTVWSIYGQDVERSLGDCGIRSSTHLVPDGEKYKSLESAERLYGELLKSGLVRRDWLIAIGGGVVGDLAGFVAATYMRGVPLVHVPTTLLAQVDSSVGGKVAVNHPKSKNLVGTFYPPRLVWSDVRVLRTLPRRELRAGLAEVIKCAFLSGGALLDRLETTVTGVLVLEPSDTEFAVAEAVRFKASVVEEDEREAGRRAVLNFGHTVGHALESLTGYERYLHGEAVAVGMIVAARLSVRLGMLDPRHAERLMDLVAQAGLPTKLEVPPLEIIDRLRTDKKRLGEEPRLVLLVEPGRPVVREVAVDDLRSVLEDELIAS